MLDTVFFELEGVLADTAVARKEALLSALHDDGIALTDQEFRDCCAGLAVEDALRAAARLRGATPDDTAVSLGAARAERAYRGRIGKGLTLVEGAREVLERLHAVARLGLVTRSARSEAQFVLSLGRLEDFFSCVVTADDVATGKPSAVPFRAALSRLERVRQHRARGLVVALEDALPGVRAARAASIACVVVGDVPAHVALEADGFLPSITGLTPDSLFALAVPRGNPQS